MKCPNCIMTMFILKDKAQSFFTATQSEHQCTMPKKIITQPEFPRFMLPISWKLTNSHNDRQSLLASQIYLA